MSDPTAAPLAVTFVVRSLALHLRFFDEAILETLARGHRVELLSCKGRENAHERAWVSGLAAREARFSSSTVDPWARDPWYRLARSLRGALDYLDLCSSPLRGLEALVARNARRAPRWAILGQRLLGRMGLVWPLLRLTRALDRSLPGSPWLSARLEARRPDVLVVAPSFMAGSADSRFVLSAREAGTPCCVAVATWDDLACKQRLATVPDRVLVWNEALARDAVSRHRIPQERLVVTGAHCFDRWFDRAPGDRKAWCARLGIDPERPYVLFVGGSLGRRTAAEGTTSEAEWVRRWVAAIRSSSDPVLRSVVVVLRPHPHHPDEWGAARFEDLHDVVVWPRFGVMPIAENARADYFESLAHSAAVVGLNTSAMVEAAIVGRPVLTIEPKEFVSAQRDRPHFRYLTDGPAPLFRPAPDLDSHVQALAEALHHSGDDPRSRAFVEWFVRPHGLQRPAREVFVDAIEQAASIRVQPARTPGVVRRALLSVFTIPRRRECARKARHRRKQRTRAV